MLSTAVPLLSFKVYQAEPLGGGSADGMGWDGMGTVFVLWVQLYLWLTINPMTSYNHTLQEEPGTLVKAFWACFAHNVTAWWWVEFPRGQKRNEYFDSGKQNCQCCGLFVKPFHSGFWTKDSPSNFSKDSAVFRNGKPYMHQPLQGVLDHHVMVCCAWFPY